jgi:hypothetical protein
MERKLMTNTFRGEDNGTIKTESLLLPHGYEGQGELSILQEEWSVIYNFVRHNMFVADCTTQLTSSTC